MQFQALARRSEVEVTTAVLVFLEHVATSDGRLVGVGRREFRNVHAVLASLDLLQENFDANVVPGVGETANASINEYFNKFAAAGIMAHVLEQLIGEEVIHEALVGVGITELPVSLGGHPEDGFLHIVAQCVLSLNVVRLLGEAGRCLAKDLKLRGPDVIRLAGERTATAVGIKNHKGALGAREAGSNAFHHRPPVRAHDEDGQVGIKIPSARVEEDKVSYHDFTGEQPGGGREGAHLESGVVHQVERSSVGR